MKHIAKYLCAMGAILFVVIYALGWSLESALVSVIIGGGVLFYFSIEEEKNRW